MLANSLATISVAVVAAAATIPAFAAQGPASDRLSLVRVRELARLASPERRAALATIEAARGRERQAGAYANPTLVLSHEQARHGETRNSQVIALVEQPLELVGQARARRDAARHVREAAEAGMALVEADLDLAVTRAYAEAWAADRRAALVERMLAAFDRAIAVSARRLAAGDVSGLAHRRLALEGARWAAALANAELGRSTVRLALAALIAREPDSVVVLAELPLDPPIVEPVAPAVDALRLLAMERRPDLRAARSVATAAGAGVRVAERDRIPIPTVAAGYKSERSAGLAARLTGFTLGFALPLPLWNRRGGLLDAAEAEARGRAADVAVVERRVLREVTTAYHAVEAIERQRVALAPRLGAAADTALAAAEAAFTEGDLTLVEWLDAQRAYHDAMATLITVEAEAVVRRAELDRASGGALTVGTREELR